MDLRAIKQRIPSFLIGLVLGSILTVSIFYSTGTHGARGVASRGAIIGPFTGDRAMANPITVSDDNKYMGLPCRFQNLPGRTNWGYIVAWDAARPRMRGEGHSTYDIDRLPPGTTNSNEPEFGYEIVYPVPDKYVCVGFYDDGVKPTWVNGELIRGDSYRIGHLERREIK